MCSFLLKDPLCNSQLGHYLPLLLYMSLRSHVVPRSIPSCVLTCVIFTYPQTSHMMYHVISSDPLTSHMMSHVTNPNA